MAFASQSQGFRFNVVAVFSNCRANRPVAAKRNANALGDFEIHLLAHVLDGVDKFTRQPFGDQILVELRIEPHHQRTFRADGQPFLGNAHHFDVGGGQFNRFSVQLNGNRFAGRDGRNLLGGEAVDQRHSLFHQRPELGAELLEVGLGLDGGQLRGVGRKLDRANVELVGDQVFQCLDIGKQLFVVADHMHLGERLAVLELVLGAQRTAHFDGAHHEGHLSFEHLVALGVGGGREVAEMHRLGTPTRGARTEILVDGFGDEGREGRGDFGKAEQHVVEGGVGLHLVAVVLALPEAAAGAADVPVGEVFDEGDERTDGGLEVVAVHGVGYLLFEACQRALDPAIHQVVALRNGLLRRPSVNIGVGDKEGICVPPRQQQVAERMLHALLRKAQGFGADDGGIDHVEAQGIRAIFVDDVDRVGVILEPFAHLQSVFGQHEAVDDDVLEGGLVEQRGGEHHQRVEPTARLVEPLGNEVGREVGLEMFLVFERVVVLRVGHCAGLEPTVEHLGGALVGLAVPLNEDLVDIVLVQIVDLDAGQLFQLLDG